MKITMEHRRALRDAVTNVGGVAKLSEKSGVSPGALYGMLHPTSCWMMEKTWGKLRFFIEKNIQEGDRLRAELFAANARIMELEEALREIVRLSTPNSVCATASIARK